VILPDEVNGMIVKTIETGREELRNSIKKK